MSKTITPWGWWEVLLEAPYCKVKQILVQPNHRLSYQKHFKRLEYWTIVKGTATVTLNGEVIELNEGECLHIPVETLHRVANKGTDDLIFIEVQKGSYFGEDDILRIADDYGRAGKT